MKWKIKEMLCGRLSKILLMTAVIPKQKSLQENEIAKYL